MKRTIALIVALVMVLVCFASFSVSADEEEYYNREFTVYKVTEAPTIDGIISDDEIWPVVSVWPYDDEMMSRGDYVENIEAVLYMAYDEDNLYYAVQTECDEPHVALMDNDTMHYIFNGHHVMTAIIPDDPTNGNYPGASDWATLYNGGFFYEWSMIYTSEATASHAADTTFTTDHFLNMTSQATIACTSEDGYDTYEVAIPWSAMTSKLNPDGLSGVEGEVFGFDFSIGLSNVSDIPEVIANSGYDGVASDDGNIYYGNYLYFAGLYGNDLGAKAPNRAAIMTLGGEYEDPFIDDPTYDPEFDEKFAAFVWDIFGDPSSEQFINDSIMVVPESFIAAYTEMFKEIPGVSEIDFTDKEAILQLLNQIKALLPEGLYEEIIGLLSLFNVGKLQGSEGSDFLFTFIPKVTDDAVYFLVGYQGDIVGSADNFGNGKGTNIRMWFNTNDEATVYTHFIDIAYDGDNTPDVSGKKNGSLTSNSGATAISTDGVEAECIVLSGDYYVQFKVPFSVIEATKDFGCYITVSNGTDAEKGVVNNAMIYPVGLADGLDATNSKNYFPYTAWNDAAIIVPVKGSDTPVDPVDPPVKPGDDGMIALAVIAVISLAGTAIVVKKH